MTLRNIIIIMAHHANGPILLTPFCSRFYDISRVVDSVKNVGNPCHCFSTQETPRYLYLLLFCSLTSSFNNFRHLVTCLVKFKRSTQKLLFSYCFQIFTTAFSRSPLWKSLTKANSGINLR